MLIKTNITKITEEADAKIRYDAAVKKVLSDPQILAWILQYTVKEFKDYNILDIMACIEGNPEIAVSPVHPGAYTNAVEGLSTEDADIHLQRVTYDIRFHVRIPEQGTVGMIINVEAQNKFYEKYDLVTRGIFYCARLLSSQVRNEESAEEYNHLQKVYSIWICMQAPLNSEYTITGYHMCREDVHGHMVSTANQRYDLMEMVMVCLGRPEDAPKGTRLHQLLTTVLSKDLTPKQKQKIMKENYEIVTTVELEGGLVKMCNLSEYIEEKGIQKGMEQGIEQGLSALVNSLKDYVQDEALYQAVIKNEVYKDISREDVFKYLNV